MAQSLASTHSVVSAGSALVSTGAVRLQFWTVSDASRDCEPLTGVGSSSPKLRPASVRLVTFAPESESATWTLTFTPGAKARVGVPPIMDLQESKRV
jgi:hypothetical protein